MINDFFVEIAQQNVDFTAFEQYFWLAMANPFLFMLFTVIVIDITTGIFASLKNHAFDSSIGFNGWIKHTSCLLICIIIEFAANAISAPIIANTVCFFAMFFYLGSIPGNLIACGLKLPKFIEKYFKAEIKRKLNKWSDKNE